LKYKPQKAAFWLVTGLLLLAGTHIDASEEKCAVNSAKINPPSLVTFWRQASTNNKQDGLISKTDMGKLSPFKHMSLHQSIVRQQLINILTTVTGFPHPLSSVTIDYLHGAWKHYASVPIAAPSSVSKHVAFAVYQGRQVLLASGLRSHDDHDSDSEDKESTYNKPLNIWDLATGRLCTQFSVDKSEPCKFEATSDGTKIILCSRYRIYAYDTHTGHQLFQVNLPVLYSLHIYSTGLSTLAIDMHSKSIAVALYANEAAPLTLLTLESDGVVQNTYETPQYGICQLCFSPNGKLLATRSSQGEIIIWDLATKEPLHKWRDGSSYHTLGKSFFFENNICLVASANDTIREWALPKLEESLSQHYHPVIRNNCNYLEKALNHRTIAAATMDKEKRYITIEEAGPIPFTAKFEVGDSHPVCLAPDGDYFATVDEQSNREQAAHIWHRSYDINE